MSEDLMNHQVIGHLQMERNAAERKENLFQAPGFIGTEIKKLYFMTVWI